MPRLLLFVPCDKVVVNQEDSDISLLGLMEGVAAKLPDSISESEPAQIPYRWYTVSQWIAEGKDKENLLQQQVQIVLPNGQLSGLSQTDLRFSENLKFTAITKGNGLPVIGLGIYYFRLSYRERTHLHDDSEWRIVANYPFSIISEP